MTSQTFAFGTYIPGNSPIHGMNAQVKIVLACVFCIAIFAVDTWAGLLAMCAVVMLLFALGRIPLGRALAGLKPVMFILAFTVLAHALAFGGHSLGGVGSVGLTQELALGGGISLSLDGLFEGLFFALRIAAVVGACSVLTFCSTMLEISDGLYALLAPLKRLRVPVEDICTVVSLALRLIPITAEEAERLVDARRSRGAALGSGSLAARARAWAGVLSPLVVQLFRRAETLADAMDARAYAGQGRTRLSYSRASAVQVVGALVVAVAVVCWCVAA